MKSPLSLSLSPSLHFCFYLNCSFTMSFPSAWRRENSSDAALAPNSSTTCDTTVKSHLPFVVVYLLYRLTQHSIKDHDADGHHPFFSWNFYSRVLIPVLILSQSYKMQIVTDTLLSKLPLTSNRK